MGELGVEGIVCITVEEGGRGVGGDEVGEAGRDWRRRGRGICWVGNGSCECAGDVTGASAKVEDLGEVTLYILREVIRTMRSSWQRKGTVLISVHRV